MKSASFLPVVLSARAPPLCRLASPTAPPRAAPRRRRPRRRACRCSNAWPPSRPRVRPPPPRAPRPCRRRWRPAGCWSQRWKQVLASPVGARFCMAGQTDRGRGRGGLRIRPRRSRRALAAIARAPLFDRLIPNRELLVRGTTLLTITRPGADAPAADAGAPAGRRLRRPVNADERTRRRTEVHSKRRPNMTPLTYIAPLPPALALALAAATRCRPADSLGVQPPRGARSSPRTPRWTPPTSTCSRATSPGARATSP